MALDGSAEATILVAVTASVSLEKGDVREAIPFAADSWTPAHEIIARLAQHLAERAASRAEVVDLTLLHRDLSNVDPIAA